MQVRDGVLRGTQRRDKPAEHSTGYLRFRPEADDDNGDARRRRDDSDPTPHSHDAGREPPTSDGDDDGRRLTTMDRMDDGYVDDAQPHDEFDVDGLDGRGDDGVATPYVEASPGIPHTPQVARRLDMPDEYNIHTPGPGRSRSARGGGK